MVTLRYEDDDWKVIERGEEKSNKDVVIDGRLKVLGDHVKKDLNKDFDFAMIIFGSVGSGKSNLGRLFARYVSDEKFHPRTHIVQDAGDIKKVILSAKKGEAVIFDEASGIFASADALTKKTKYAQYVLDVCRQKNLCLIIIAPAMHRLSSAVAIDRTKVALRTYTTKDGRRGPFAFYGGKLKEKLYREAKKNHGSIKGVKPKWRGTCGLDKTFTPEYRKAKDETLRKALDSFDPVKDRPPTPREIVKERNLEIIKNNIDKPREVMASMLNVSMRTIDRLRQEAKKEEMPLILNN